MDNPSFSVQEIIKPETELSTLTRDIFDNTVSYGQNDYVIVMFNTKNISNCKTLNLALKNILPISKTTNLVLLSECNAPIDQIINHKLGNAINRFSRLNRNVSFKFLIDRNQRGSKFEIFHMLKNHLNTSKYNNVVLKTIHRIEIGEVELDNTVFSLGISTVHDDSVVNSESCSADQVEEGSFLEINIAEKVHL